MPADGKYLETPGEDMVIPTVAALFHELPSTLWRPLKPELYSAADYVRNGKDFRSRTPTDNGETFSAVVYG